MENDRGLVPGYWRKIMENDVSSSDVFGLSPWSFSIPIALHVHCVIPWPYHEGYHMPFQFSSHPKQYNQRRRG